MACGPLLIINSRIQSSAFSSIGAHCTGRHPRSAVGITGDRRLNLLTADGRTEWASGLTCEELARVMDRLGCSNALNLDGGGSTTLWGGGAERAYDNGVLNYPCDNGEYDRQGERSCANAIAIVAPATGPVTWDGRHCWNGLFAVHENRGRSDGLFDLSEYRTRMVDSGGNEIGFIAARIANQRLPRPGNLARFVSSRGPVGFRRARGRRDVHLCPESALRRDGRDFRRIFHVDPDGNRENRSGR
jgi:hypothetical protein